MTRVRNDLSDYVVDDIECLASGFLFTEGPVWNPSGYLLFSDMPGDVRRRWDPDTGVSVVRQPANKCNGMAYDGMGRLVVCEHSTSRVVRESPDGTVEMLAAKYEGMELNSPNDVIVSLNGDIYFSDPSFGRTPGFGVERDVELSFRGVYLLPAGGGGLELVDDDFGQPNGLCLSPDESILYVNDTEKSLIVAYERHPDGSVGEREIFADGIGTTENDLGVVDGMKCDLEGNVLVTGPLGIWVLDRHGTHLGTIEVPEVAANMGWGGEMWSTLFITASTSLYRVETSVRGAPVPNMERESREP